jgi:hypothetical protein
VAEHDKRFNAKVSLTRLESGCNAGLSVKYGKTRMCLKGTDRWTRDIDGREGWFYVDHEGSFNGSVRWEFIEIREAKVNKDDTCIPFKLG